MPTDPVYLRDYSCFRGLSDDQLTTIAEFTNAICYQPGYTLFREGDPGERVFFLVKGDVEVLHTTGDNGQTRLDTVSGEEVVGCSALIDPYVYTATERSLTEVEVLEVDALSLREMMQSDCSFGLTIQQHILRVLMERILHLRLRAPV
jgi:CRP/FNR family transcriptional regulator, cyclic AMP receptor protein